LSNIVEIARAGVDFTNKLNGSFNLHAKIPKAQKLSHQWLFALLGSARVKALSKILMKLTPGVNFINVLHTAFTPVGLKSAKRHC